MCVQIFAGQENNNNDLQNSGSEVNVAGATEQLFQAIQDNDYKKMVDALNKGADIRAEKNSKTPLSFAHACIRKNADSIIKLLSDHEDKIDNSLIEAVVNGDYEQAVDALSRGALVNQEFGPFDSDLIAMAVKNCRKEKIVDYYNVVNLLLDHGAHVSPRTQIIKGKRQGYIAKISNSLFNRWHGPVHYDAVVHNRRKAVWQQLCLGNQNIKSELNKAVAYDAIRQSMTLTGGVVVALKIKLNNSLNALPTIIARDPGFDAINRTSLTNRIYEYINNDQRQIKLFGAMMLIGIGTFLNDPHIGITL